MTPSPDSSAGTSRRAGCARSASADVRSLSLIGTSRTGSSGGPRGPVVVAVRSASIQSGATRNGTASMASSSRACSDSCLVRAAGPCGIDDSARHEQQVSGQRPQARVRAESSPVPTVPKNALFAACPAPGPASRPADPAFSGFFFPVVTAPGQPRQQCSRPGPIPAPGPAALPEGTGRACSPVPAARPDAGRHGRATAPAPGPRQSGDHVPGRASSISVISTYHPDHETPWPVSLFPFPFHEPGAQRRPPRDRADGTRPGLVLQRPQRRVTHRARPWPGPARPS